MLKVIAEQSRKATVPEIDLFSIPDTSVGVVSSRYVECPLTNTLTNGIGSGPLEWRYNMQRNYLNLAKSFIQFKIKITNEKGESIAVNKKGTVEKVDSTTTTAPPTTTTPLSPNPIAFAQCIGKTLFKQFVLYINNCIVEDSSPLYAWRSIIETDLNFDKGTKNSTLSQSGYALDTDPNSSISPGHLRRQTWVQDGEFAQFTAHLNLSMFNQNRLLLNYVDFKLIAYLNDPQFVIDALEIEQDQTKYQYEVADIKLILNEYELADGASSAIEQMLKERKMISYPLTNVECRSFFIGPNIFETSELRLLTSSVPKRIVMCFVDSEAYLGSYKKTPFNFGHFDVKDIFINAGGRTIPAQPQNLNFETNDYMPAYSAMLEGSGMARSTGNNGITREMFKQGSCYLIFELSTCLDSNTFDLIKLGTTSFKIFFRKATPPQGCYCVIHCEYDSLLTFDENRTPHVNSMM